MIVPTLAKLIVKEHLYKPIKGKVLSLGRQTIAMTYEEVIDLLKQERCLPSKEILSKLDISYDQETRERKCGYVSDKLFWELLEVTDLVNLDVSDYEGADIIHNLNEPIPESLQERFDFIIDGGTFDHLVDLRVAFQNCAKLLKSGGRIFQWNAASNGVGAAYISLGPNLFYDFYVLNQFNDCKVYIAEIDDWGQLEDWDFYLLERSHALGSIRSGRIQLVVVLAEKGELSSWNLVPIQAAYRDEELWAPYRNGEMALEKSNRKPWTGRGEVASVQRPGFLKQSLTWLRVRIPRSLKKKIPMKVKAVANNAISEKKSTGFRYIGRI